MTAIMEENIREKDSSFVKFQKACGSGGKRFALLYP